MLGLDGGLHRGEIEGLAVGSADHLGFAAEGLGSPVQRSPNLPAVRTTRLVAGRGEVGDGGFHGAGARGGEQEHVVIGADKDLQLREHLLVKGAELRRAVVHVGGCHGELGGGKQGSGSGGIKAGLADHGLSLWPGLAEPVNHRIHIVVVYVNCSSVEIIDSGECLLDWMRIAR